MCIVHLYIRTSYHITGRCVYLLPNTVTGVYVAFHYVKQSVGNQSTSLFSSYFVIDRQELFVNVVVLLLREISPLYSATHQGNHSL